MDGGGNPGTAGPAAPTAGGGAATAAAGGQSSPHSSLWRSGPGNPPYPGPAPRRRAGRSSAPPPAAPVRQTGGAPPPEEGCVPLSLPAGERQAPPRFFPPPDRERRTSAPNPRRGSPLGVHPGSDGHPVRRRIRPPPPGGRPPGSSPARRGRGGPGGRTESPPAFPSQDHPAGRGAGTRPAGIQARPGQLPQQRLPLKSAAIRP